MYVVYTDFSAAWNIVIMNYAWFGFDLFFFKIQLQRCIVL